MNEIGSRRPLFATGFAGNSIGGLGDGVATTPVRQILPVGSDRCAGFRRRRELAVAPQPLPGVPGPVVCITPDLYITNFLEPGF